MILIPNVPCKYVDKYPTEIDFILLHKLIDNEYYRNYYINNKDNGKWKVIDNSAYELGSGLDSELLLEWAEKINASEIIIPDVYGDKDETLKLMNDFLKKYPNCKYKLMVVPQGANERELYDCYIEMLENDKIYSIGLNKLWRKDSYMINNIFKEVVEYCDKPIHLLGVNKLSEWAVHFKHRIRSADSRILSQIILGTDDIWESELTEEQQEALYNLIKEVRWW